jgi:hypothetical protein
MCGESMAIVTRERADRIPGTRETHVHQVREWRCRDCDHFEEADSDDQSQK